VTFVKRFTLLAGSLRRLGRGDRITPTAAPAAQPESEQHQTSGEPAGGDLQLGIGEDVIVGEHIERNKCRAG